MIKTGYIAFITETGGGQDGDGNTIPTTKISSVYIECNLKVMTKEYKTFIDGQYKQASYGMYVDMNKFESLNPELDLTTISLIDLQDNNKNSLGRFQIQNKEYLNLSKRIIIVV